MIYISWISPILFLFIKEKALLHIAEKADRRDCILYQLDAERKIKQTVFTVMVKNCKNVLFFLF